MIEIKEVTLDEILPQVFQLLIEHREESTTHKHLMILNPNWEKYQQMERSGLLLILAAFDGDKAVGYSLNIVTKHLHYKDLVYSNNDVLFVSKDYRGTKAGIKLILEAEKACKAKGSKFHILHAKQDTALDKLLPRVGYTVQDIIYSKEL